MAQMAHISRTVDAPNLRGLFGETNRRANAPAEDVSLAIMFEAPATSSTTTQRAPPPPPSSAAALEAAAAIPLPGNDDDDLDSDALLAGSDDNEAEQEAPPYEEDEEGMDVSDIEEADPPPPRNTVPVGDLLHQGEVEVGPSRAWAPSSLKDGMQPKSVREIAIQCDYGDASLQRRRNYLVAARRRHDRRRREKKKAEKRARDASRHVTHPDAEAAQTAPPRPAANPPSSGGGVGNAPSATTGRKEEAQPAKRARQEPPSKKKEAQKAGTARFSPVRAPAPHLERQPQPNVSSGVTSAPRYKVDFHQSARPTPAPKARDNRVDIVPRRRSAPPKKAPKGKNEPHLNSNTFKMIEAFVNSMSEAFKASRRHDRSPSPQPHCSHDYRSGSRHHSNHHGGRSRFEQEEEEQERGRSRSRGKSRSRSRSRGRSRDRRPPPYRGKGKGRGKGRGK